MFIQYELELFNNNLMKQISQWDNEFLPIKYVIECPHDIINASMFLGWEL